MEQPHIKLSTDTARQVAIVVGDPARALSLAKLCDHHKEIVFNREYRSFDCRHNSKYFLVISHGIGGAGAAICFEELIKCGVHTIIRAGTCGSLTPDAGQGDLIIATAAIREDGASRLMIPTEYPAVADIDLVCEIEAHAKAAGVHYLRGIVLTSDLFYPSILPTSLEQYSKAKVKAVEMEAATLYVVASLRGIRAAALFTIDGSPLKWDKGDYDPHGTKVADGKARMLDIALNVASSLSTDSISRD